MPVQDSAAGPQRWTMRTGQPTLTLAGFRRSPKRALKLAPGIAFEHLRASLRCAACVRRWRTITLRKVSTTSRQPPRRLWRLGLPRRLPPRTRRQARFPLKVRSLFRRTRLCARRRTRRSHTLVSSTGMAGTVPLSSCPNGFVLRSAARLRLPRAILSVRSAMALRRWRRSGCSARMPRTWRTGPLLSLPLLSTACCGLLMWGTRRRFFRERACPLSFRFLTMPKPTSWRSDV
eukprot:Amastigsp_a841277_294.p3 type:complete len:233 gc:universal Amastigsp_a841277_294:181-879(+)